MGKIEINKVVIIGAGRMGSTIAIAMAQAGVKVTVSSRKDKNKIFTFVEPRLSKSVKKGELTAEGKAGILENISGTTDIKTAVKADLVLETIVENLEIKKKLFEKLDSICPPEVIFATNTSALSVECLSLATKRKDRFVGMHFFNPADKVNLIEIVRTNAVGDKVIERIENFATNLGKEYLVVKDTPGFIVNRLLFLMINEAASLVKDKVASPADIDKAMQLGANHPVGPLILADIIGLDVCLEIMKSIYKRTKDKKYFPCSLIIEKVKKCQLGKKTRLGFYNYEK